MVEKMKILITGNMGYVGTVLSQDLNSKMENISIVGLDTGYFSSNWTVTGPIPNVGLTQQIQCDIRRIHGEMLRGYDAVVHLAAISNDPMGSEFEVVTKEINQTQSIRIAEMAAEAGVKNFVFASSCSMYGNNTEKPRTENDKTNPLTAYAKSKLGTERGLEKGNYGEMIITSLRFATACGYSPRLRLDLVLNDFVASALATRKIVVLSDGSPWRPLIDVNDMCRAIRWAILRTKENGGQFLAINAGSNRANYQVKEVAKAVSNIIEGTEISINSDAVPDKRSYKVDFSLFEKLAPNYLPITTLQQSINNLKDGLVCLGFNDPDFRSSDLIRLNVLRKLISEKHLSKNLEVK
jgi:nucleoside-diphosphate-sugar epimerase